MPPIFYRGASLWRQMRETTPAITWTVGGLVAILIVLLLGLAILGYQQSDLDSLASETKSIQIANEKAIAIDSAVLRALNETPPPDLTAYVVAREAFGAADIQHLLSSNMPASKINELRKGWQDVMDLLRHGQRDEARQLYVTRKLASVASDISQRTQEVTRVSDSAYMAKKSRMLVTTILIVVLQLVAGIATILAFVASLHRNNRESTARLHAVTAATKSREQVLRLFEMADMLQSSADYADANAVLNSTASELIFGFSGALYVFNNSRDRLVLSTSWDREGYPDLPQTLGISQCWALKRGKPHINRPNTRKLCCEHHASADHALEIPMIARGEILGLLQIYADGDDAEQRLQSISSLGAALADAMSLALANIALREKLRGQALRDPLTNLYNRRYMEDSLDRLLRLAGREKRELSVIMIDLDHFKRLNDQFGHAKGDSVLRDSAAAILRRLRESDVACRYGGEEMIALLPDCDADMAVKKAEEIRQGIEALSVPGGASVSASFGVASTISGSSKELLAAADAALYRAKQTGRNRVICSNQRERVVVQSDTVSIISEAAE